MRHVFAQIDSLQRVPPSAEEVARIQEQQRRARETSLRENRFWLSSLDTYAERGWDLRTVLHEERQTEALTPAQVQATARKLLGRKRYVEVYLLPEAAQ